VELPPQEFTPQFALYHDAPTAVARSQLGAQQSCAFVVEYLEVEGFAWISILAGKGFVPYIAKAICLILKVVTPLGLDRPTLSAPEFVPQAKFAAVNP